MRSALMAFACARTVKFADAIRSWQTNFPGRILFVEKDVDLKWKLKVSTGRAKRSRDTVRNHRLFADQAPKPMGFGHKAPRPFPQHVRFSRYNSRGRRSKMCYLPDLVQDLHLDVLSEVIRWI